MMGGGFTWQRACEVKLVELSQVRSEIWDLCCL